MNYSDLGLGVRRKDLGLEVDIKYYYNYLIFSETMTFLLKSV
jgi:hypothetical protein